AETLTEAQAEWAVKIGVPEKFISKIKEDCKIFLSLQVDKSASIILRCVLGGWGVKTFRPFFFQDENQS
ncbi:MAG: hypothetical protein II109_03315, partial [Paludibacteraceae bacterium]|nr:hypothetical protein [Paludibacteraceae bacterium]